MPWPDKTCPHCKKEYSLIAEVYGCEICKKEICSECSRTKTCPQR